MTINESNKYYWNIEVKFTTLLLQVPSGFWSFELKRPYVLAI